MKSEAGPAEVVAVYIAGPLMHIRLLLDGHVIDAAQNDRPRVGNTVALNLSRAKFYPIEADANHTWL